MPKLLLDNHFMKEHIKELELILRKIARDIDYQITIRQVNLEHYDQLQDPSNEDETYKEWRKQFRQDIVEAQNDKSFYDVDLPQLHSILENAIKDITLHSSRVSGPPRNNEPNTYLVALVKRNLVSTDSVIKGYMYGKEFCGHLTADGFLEISTGNAKRRFGSLRYAAYELWGKDIPSQWKFWKVDDVPLEHFKQQLVVRKG
ncbi:MAG: hypothetical protein EOO13_05465 [Chitinophagaceae bacterium]|nr:MAG: hypothetical protein EOO13_05465 [Chitinophagaceae bacterium]